MVSDQQNWSKCKLGFSQGRRNNALQIKDDCIDLPSDLELETGMVINLEAGFFIRGYGAYQNEQSFVLTETGGEHIAPRNRGVPIVAV